MAEMKKYFFSNKIAIKIADLHEKLNVAIPSVSDRRQILSVADKALVCL